MNTDDFGDNDNKVKQFMLYFLHSSIIIWIGWVFKIWYIIWIKCLGVSFFSGYCTRKPSVAKMPLAMRWQWYGTASVESIFFNPSKKWWGGGLSCSAADYVINTSRSLLVKEFISFLPRFFFIRYTFGIAWPAIRQKQGFSSQQYKWIKLSSLL